MPEAKSQKTRGGTRAAATPAAEPGLGGRSVQLLLALRDELARGVYPNGSQLPTERELCVRFGASRPTVFRAIRQLVRDGRVEVRRGAGMFARVPEAALARSRTIAVMYPFSGNATNVVQAEILKRGALPCVFSQIQHRWDPQLERLFLNQVRHEGHRALLAFCSPSPPHNDDLLAEIVSAGVRVIHLEPYRKELPGQEYLLPDYQQAGYMGAVELLIAGARSLVFVCNNFSEADPELDPPYVQLLYRGVETALATHARKGLSCRRANVGWHSYQPEVGRAQLEALLASLKPGSGVLCHNLDLAAAIAAAVPRSVPALAVDYAPFGEAFAPTVDTIAIDRLAVMVRAVEHVLGERGGPGLRQLVPPHLVRASG